MWKSPTHVQGANACSISNSKVIVSNSDRSGIKFLVHHLFNKNGSFVGTKSLAHFFKDGGL